MYQVPTLNCLLQFTKVVIEDSEESNWKYDDGGALWRANQIIE